MRAHTLASRTQKFVLILKIRGYEKSNQTLQNLCAY